MNSTIAWMTSGGRRFDAAWEERSRQRAALAEARRDRPALAARLLARPTTNPACCPA